MSEATTTLPSDSDRPMRVAVVQDGARLHYAAPLAFYRQGVLERIFCEYYARPFSLSRLAAHLMKRMQPAVGQRMLDRYCPGLAGSPPARIISNPLLTWKVVRRRRHVLSDYAYFSWAASMNAAWIQRKGFGRANALFGFIRCVDPKLLGESRKQGLINIADQMIAPYAVEMQEEAIQRERFPDWAVSPASTADDAAWIDWEERTWPLLDHITCASEYVREGLIGQGIEPQRITVNPYPADDTHFPAVDRTSRKGPLTVGFVGTVNLRKGAPYFCQTAAHFDPAKVRFVMVGPIGITQIAIEKHRGSVELVGPVPRSQITEWLGRMDLYYFPSTCEGSAQSVMEAMMTGLPVITTPNAGAVARDGVDGCIIRYDDISAAVEAIENYVSNPGARHAAGQAAARRAREFTLEAFARCLSTTIERIQADHKHIQTS